MAAKKKRKKARKTGSGRRGRKAKRVLVDTHGVLRTTSGKVLKGDTNSRTMFYKRVKGKD